MKKYVWVFMALLLISFFVTCEKEKHAHDANTQSAIGSYSAVAGANSIKAKSDEKNTKGYTPSWEMAVIYHLFGWPEGVTVWALLLTLMVIADQTSQTRKAAEAALQQADHTIASERAWLVISSVTNSGSVIRPGFSPHYWWQVKNLGSTPARLIETQAICTVNTSQTLPEQPSFRDRPVELHERILAPGDTLEFWSFWENDDGRPFRERIETLDWIALRAYGYIKYKTIFGSEIRESRFCDYFNHTPNSPIAYDTTQYVIDFRSDLTAPAEYTKHT